jgi:hypothetical protein
MKRLTREEKKKLVCFTAYSLIMEPKQTPLEAFLAALGLTRISKKVDPDSAVARRIIKDSESLLFKSQVAVPSPIQTPIAPSITEKSIKQIQDALQTLSTQLQSVQDETRKIESKNKDMIEKASEEVFLKLAEPMVAALTEQVTERISSRFDLHAHNAAQSAVSKILSNQKLVRNVEQSLSYSRSETETKKLTILIVGLLPVQENEIRQIYGDKHDLRFFKSEDNLHQLQSSAATADIVLVAASFVGHRHIDCVKNHNSNVVLYHGGTSKLKQVMEAEIEKNMCMAHT